MNTVHFTVNASANYAMPDIESPSRIEPALIDEPTSAIADVVADLAAAVSILGKFLHPLIRMKNAVTCKSKRRRMSECKQKSISCF
jgi:hypothetical protein